MVFEKIRDIAAEQLSKEASEITPETDMQKDLDADSLDVFQIISDIEDEFDVKIENVEGLNTVGDVVNLVEGLIKEK